jgi:hypothetical protein
MKRVLVLLACAMVLAGVGLIASLFATGEISAQSCACSGTTGRIAKFSGPNAIADSVMIEANGRIGIGTPNPQEKLDVIGGAFFRGASTGASFGVNQAGTGPVARFLKSGMDVLTIANSGLVGVGTTSPSERLHVAGNVQISGTGNGIIFPDGTTQTTAALTSSNDWFIGGNLADLLAGGGKLNAYPPEQYEYGFRYVSSNTIEEAICTRWNFGLRFYNKYPNFVDSDDPSGGMAWGGTMWYINTAAADDDAATPTHWRHGFWKMDFNDAAKGIRIFHTNGFNELNVYCRKR